MNPTLDIVIVNWNAGAQLSECLASIAAASKARFTLGRVVVVDNGSRDGSLEGLDAYGLPLKVIANGANRGFGAACNQGAAAGEAAFLLFLNPDVRLDADSLDLSVAFLDDAANARFGVCGIQLVDAAGVPHRSCARHPRPGHFAAKLTGLNALAPRLFPSHVMAEWDHAADRVVDHVMGAFYLVRRSLFETLSGFDPRFFVYLEDLDLSVRVQREGFQTMFLARAKAYHRSGGVSEKAKAARLYYSLHSRMLYGRKHFSPATAFALAAGTLVVEPVVRGVALILRGRLRELGETASGYRRLWSAVLSGNGPVETAGV